MKYTITCDTHTHTLYSRHAYSTVNENVQAAAARGLGLLAITDHFSDMLRGVGDVRDYQYLLNMEMLPRRWNGVALLRGVEADIIDLEGHLYGHEIVLHRGVSESTCAPITLEDRILPVQDYVIASVHGKAFADGASLAATTQMYCRALEHPKVFVLGHIGRTGVPFDTDEVLLCAKAHGKLIELNEHSFDKEGEGTRRCREIAVRCAELDVSVSLGSDAHVCTAVGRFARTLAMLTEIGFPEKLIASRSPQTFLEALRASGVFLGFGEEPEED